MGFEQTTYTFREDAGIVDACVAFFQPDEIDSRVFVELTGSTTDGSADGESNDANKLIRHLHNKVVDIQSEWIIMSWCTHFSNETLVPFTSYTILTSHSDPIRDFFMIV